MAAKKRTRRLFTEEEKAKVLGRVRAGESVHDIAKSIQASDSVIYRWAQLANVPAGRNAKKTEPTSGLGWQGPPRGGSALDRLLESAIEKRLEGLIEKKLGEVLERKLGKL